MSRADPVYWSWVDTRCVVIAGIPRSGKNSQRRRKLGNGRVISTRSKAAQDWMDSGVSQLLSVRESNQLPLDEPLSVHVVIYHTLPLERWDSDNVVSLTFDTLKKGLVIADDSASIIREHHVYTYVDKKHPRVVVTIRRRFHGPPATINDVVTDK